MTVLNFIVQVMSWAMLLLFAVHIMRTGIERCIGLWVGRIFSDKQHAYQLVAKGTLLGAVMQGGTVVLLMGAALSSGGTLSAASAVILALGAEFGSSIAVKALLFSPAILSPILILVGGWLYLNSSKLSKTKEVGRILLGLGLIFLALSGIRSAVAPLQGSSHLVQAIEIIGSDPMNAALVGGLASLIMHSSLVALLTAAAILAQITAPPTIVLGFVLGCNIGSALLPIWLLRSEEKTTQLVAIKALIIRAGLAVPLLLGLISFGSDGLQQLFSYGSVDVLIFGHIGFNLVLILVAPLAIIVLTYFAPKKNDNSVFLPFAQAQLHEAPELVLAGFKKQLNSMLETLSQMVDHVTATPPNFAALAAEEERTNLALEALRQQFSKLPDLPDAIVEQLHGMLDYAIKLERCADILSGKYRSIRQEEQRGVFELTPDAATSVEVQLEQLRKAIALAQHVFWKEDPFGARQLILVKQSMARLERKNRRQHFDQIKSSDQIAMRSSNQYLEIIAAHHEITSKLSATGYVILERHGQLKKTRLRSLR